MAIELEAAAAAAAAAAGGPHCGGALAVRPEPPYEGLRLVWWAWRVAGVEALAPSSSDALPWRAFHESVKKSESDGGSRRLSPNLAEDDCCRVPDEVGLDGWREEKGDGSLDWKRAGARMGPGAGAGAGVKAEAEAEVEVGVVPQSDEEGSSSSRPEISRPTRGLSEDEAVVGVVVELVLEELPP